MKKNIFAFIFLAGLCAQAAETVRVSSRNMPTDCQYVFEVNSEILIQLENLQSSNLVLAVSYQNEYTKDWSAPVNVVPEQSGPLWATKIQLRSMSTNPKYLLRKIKFAVLKSASDLSPTWYQSEFGREFGEKCYQSPRETPFKERQVTRMP